jgi:hypothetical protein
MTKRRLPDGRTAEFPDIMPENEIAQAIEDYLRSETVPSPIAVAPEHSPLEPSPEPGAPEPLRVAPLARRFRVTPYRADENDEIGELMARLPEQARKCLERSRLPAARAVDPPSDLFRGNWHANWRWRR